MQGSILVEENVFGQTQDCLNEVASLIIRTSSEQLVFVLFPKLKIHPNITIWERKEH